eukprot:Rhum_TRINITY_DN2261_c0_g1::Rhum_TRINITY_DN2261_c0_g1_i1::g.6523::m.6523
MCSIALFFLFPHTQAMGEGERGGREDLRHQPFVLATKDDRKDKDATRRGKQAVQQLQKSGSSVLLGGTASSSHRFGVAATIAANILAGWSNAFSISCTVIVADIVAAVSCTTSSSAGIPFTTSPALTLLHSSAATHSPSTDAGRSRGDADAASTSPFAVALGKATPAACLSTQSAVRPPPPRPRSESSSAAHALPTATRLRATPHSLLPPSCGSAAPSTAANQARHTDTTARTLDSPRYAKTAGSTDAGSVPP